jgi:hypothetical protein
VVVKGVVSKGPAGFLLPSAGPSLLARSPDAGLPADMAQMCHGSAATVARRESHRPVGSRRGAASGPPLLFRVSGPVTEERGETLNKMSAPGFLGANGAAAGSGFRSGSLGEECRA